MKTICLIPKRYIVAIPLMLVGVLLTCYSAAGNPRRSGTQNGVTMAGVAPRSAMEIPSISKSVVNSRTASLAPGPKACRPALTWRG